MRTLLIVSLFSVAALAGCVDSTEGTDGDGSSALVGDLMAGAPLWDDPQNTPHPAYGWPTLSSPVDNATGWHAPIPGVELPEDIAGMELIAATGDDFLDGGGIALYGSLAVVPGYGGGETAIFDISDPTAPELLSTFIPQLGGTHRGAAIIAYPDGRIVTPISMGAGIDVWDITDPTNPVGLPTIEPTQGSHKLGVVPGTPIVYNAASAGGSENGIAGEGHLPDGGVRVTEIYDLADPENPVHVMDWENGYACHHLYFFNFEDKERGVCAGIEVTQIWDTTDPLNPTVIVDVPYPHGQTGTPSASPFIASFSHFAGMNQDGTILLVGDESGGGLGPIGCVARADTPVGAVSVPNGAVWFYDISDETNPVLAGWISASQLERMTGGTVDSSCTAHHGRLVPTEGRDTIAMSFYGAGVILIDFTDPMLPVVVDQFADGSNTWETWYYNGYLFTGDLARGMDVIGFN